MKRILSTLTLLLCFAFTAVNAQVITAERAAEIANSFFSAGVQKSAAARGVVASSSLTTSFDSNDVVDTTSAEPTFYVLTNPEGGFVIVSGEETENPIIGYSLDGTIDVNNLPDGFVGYMADVDAQVKSLREYNANNPQKAAAARSAMQRAANFEYNATSMGNIVKNLNTAPWGQRTPFNNLCKTTDGQTALTGCGPTAFAILCYYYKWPASGVGTVTHQGTGENMELGHTYDYANMRNDNYSSGYSEAEANAIAVLMRDLGWANQVGYGTSSTSFSETGQHMVDHFRFKSERPVDHGASLAVVRSTLGNDTQWKTYIKNNLDAGYPIPYASTTDKSNSARHIYILDGYTDNDYYHFNWGWSGQGNGWFTLDNMVPDDYSNYSNSHKAYFNLIPDATTYTVRATATPSNMGTVSINGGTAGTTVSADLLQGVTATLTAHPAQGYALASWTKDGVVVGSRTTLQVPVGTDANDYVANFDDEANVIVVQDYTINATSGTTLTTDKIKEWAFNANNDYPAALKLTSTTESINTNNDGDCIQLYLMSGTTATYTLSVPEDYVITKYTIRCKTSSTYITSIAAEGQTYTPTKSYADYTFTKNTQARGAANSSELTIVGSANRALMVEAITVTIAKEGADVGGGSTPEPEPEQPSTPTTYTVATTANPANGGTAKFAIGTGSQKTQGDVENGTEITLYATANNGYNFVNWTLGGNVVGTAATCNVTVSQTANYVANFEENATPTPTEYPTPTGATYTNNYLTSATTTGAIENVTYSANAHPGAKLVTVPGTVRVEKGGSFTLNLVAKSLSSSTSSVAEDMRYCHASLFTDFDGDRTFGVAVQTWGNQPPTNNVAGNYSSVMNITHEITVPAEAPLGTSHVRMIYTNAWKGWPTDGTAELDKGIVYDFVVEVVETVKITASASVGGTVKINNEAIETKNVVKGSEVTLVATPQNGYEFVNWTKGETVVSTNATYAFTPAETATYKANFAINTYEINVSVNGNGGTASANVTTVNHGGSVTLTAQAKEGYHFVNWTTKDGTEVSTSVTYTVSATADATYVANFAKNTYTITAIAGEGGSASIGTETNITVEHGTSVTLVATPSVGYRFVNWTTKDGAEVSTSATYTVSATANATYTANFEKITYTIKATAGNGGSVSPTTSTVEHGTSVTLTATANDGYEFVNWTKDGTEVSTDANYTINNVTEAGEYVANFQLANTPATHCNVTVNANISGTGIAFIDTGTSTDVTSGRYEVGSIITLTAVSDKDENGYLFVGWYIGDKLISPDKMYTVTLDGDVTYTAKFEAGWRVTYSCNYRMGYIKVYDNDGADIGGTNYVLVKKGATIQMVGAPERGYQFKDWTANATGDFVTAKNPYYLTVDGNKTIYANFEPKSYVLTVTANDDSYGTVSVESGEFSSNTSVKVGISMIATITAEANDGYEFVNWTTKDGVEVSKEATYEIEAIEIENVDAMKDVEYVAVFKKQVGTYYRIAYNFEVPVETPAKSAATRAVGDTYTYAVNYNTGTSNNISSGKAQGWAYASNVNEPTLTMQATVSGTPVYAINMGTNATANPKLYAHGSDGSALITPVKYTLSVPEGYIIKNYLFSYYVYNDSEFAINNVSQTRKTWLDLSVDVNNQIAEFTLSSSNNSNYIIVKNFTVTIQEVGSGEGETPEPETETVKYYVQSEACGVGGKDNALVMKPAAENGGASSIFYCVGNKLMSYATGTYVNENGDTRGLQGIGVEGGNVTINIIDEEKGIATIAAPSYLHAAVNDGTTKTYYVDHRGSDNGDKEHNFVLEEVTSLPVTISAACYATWYAPVAVQLPEDVEAWYFKGDITNVGDVRYAIMAPIGDNDVPVIVPANTGVILTGKNGKPATEGTYYFEIKNDVSPIEGNMFKGTVAAAYIQEGDYVLYNGEKGVGLYPVNADQASYSHKAYLPKNFNSSGDPQQSAGFRFSFGGTTTVEDVEIENEREEIYDLTGRKLEGISGTGIYIINGKKVIIR